MNTIFIGIAGGTGSGKSSLISLIPRFYDATEGTVEILGRPVKDYWGRVSMPSTPKTRST